MHDNVRVTKHETRKPDVQLNTYENMFAFVLDTTRTNCIIILSEWQSHVKLSSFEFTYRLGKMLDFPNIDRRYSNFSGLTIDLFQPMSRVLGTDELNRRPALNPDSTKVRCHICVEDIVGKPDCKNDCEQMNHRLKSRCVKCQRFFCKNHTAVLCQSFKGTGN